MYKRIISIFLVMCMFFSYIPSTVYATQKQGAFSLNITETDTSVSGKTDIILDWDEYNFKNTSTEYLVARKNLDKGTWEYRGDYNRDVIKVLNVYPDIKGSEQLDDWMHSLSETYDNVNIKVEEVSITEFNKNYHKYLYKNKDKLYNYDVVVFGFWDSYNEKAINKNAAGHVQKYIDAGGGVLLGHDTILYDFNAGGFTNAGFNDIAKENLDIIPAKSWDYYAVYSNMISVRQQGSVTSYPFDINGMNLTIPLSHTIGQVPLDDETVYLTFEKNYYPSEGDGPYYSYNVGGRPEGDGLVHNGEKYIDNAYLVIKNNVGFIQTGHTSGKSNLPEQMVIANIIYSLTNIHHKTNTVDQILDTKIPDKPNYEVSLNEISFSSKDEGNSYKYRVMALPLGANTPTLDSELIAALDNDSITEYGKGDIKFSNSVDTTVGGVLKNYEYILNKSATLANVNNGTLLELDENYKIKLPNEGLTSDKYLHIVAVDTANNKSLVRSINLWNALENVTVKVNYQDIDGTEILETKEVQKKYGSLFSPVVKVIVGYNYSHSLPEEEIIVGIDGNEVTEIYDKYIEKDIFITTHYELDGTTTASLYNSVYHNYKDEVVFNVADISNKEYLGYYTLGSIDGEPIPTDSYKATVIWEDDDQAIYAHYKEKITTATVEFRRSDTKELLGTYTEQGYVDDTIIIDGDKISENVIIEDLKAYSNRAEVSKSRTMHLKEDESKNIISVYLVPNVRLVTHYGVDYTTSGSAVKFIKNLEILEIEHMVYEDEIIQPIELVYDGVDNWKAFDFSEGKKIDFTSPKLTSYLVGYYKGILPSEEYNYTVDYKNTVDDKNLETQYNSGSKHIYEPANIPVLDFENINIDGVDRKVSFEPVSIEITNPSGVTRTFFEGENFTSFIPEVDSNNEFINGNYSVVINYTPFTKIKYKDEVYKADGITLEKTTNHIEKVPYDFKTYTFEETMPLSKYDIVDVKIDGVSIDNPQEYDFSVIADSYDRDIYIKYKQKSYNLKITLVDSNLEGVTHTFDTYTNIPSGKSVVFEIPTYPAFSYEESYTGENTPKSYMVEDNGKITFTADKEGNYEIFLGYREKAIVKTKYFNMKENIIQETETDVVLLGDTYEISAPLEQGYKLMYAYLDGEKYTGVTEEEIYMIEISERIHEILLYYKMQTYTLTVEYTEGGVAFGGGEYPGEAIVSLTAKPQEGYSFVDWEFIVQNGATMGKFTDFVPTNGIDVKMPYDNVVVRANFTKTDKEVIGENDTDDEDSGGGKGGKPGISEEIGVKIPPALEKLLPFLPDLKNITIEDIYRLKRQNAPYIEGYPTGVISPDGSIARSEVVKIIYNLYGQNTTVNLNVLEKFSDVDDKNWYSEAIAFATQTGVVQGYEDGTFRPDDFITRAEIASIISKFDIKTEGYTEINLTDIEDSWAKESILQLVEHDIISGYEDGTFKPNQTATRAEMVKLINRLIERSETYRVKNTFPDLTPNHWAYSDMMNAANGTNFDFNVDEILRYLEVAQSQLKEAKEIGSKNN